MDAEDMFAYFPISDVWSHCREHVKFCCCFQQSPARPPVLFSHSVQDVVPCLLILLLEACRH